VLNFNIMKKLIKVLSIFSVFMLIMLNFWSLQSCSDSNGNTSADSTKIEGDTSPVNNLTIEGFYFAKKTESGVQKTEQPVFKRGDEIYLVLQNVGEFSRGTDGLNHIELHMSISNSIGEIVAKERNILKQKGNLDLKENIAKKPFAKYKSTKEDEPGTFRFTIAVVDLIKNDSTFVEADYFLE